MARDLAKGTPTQNFIIKSSPRLNGDRLINLCFAVSQGQEC